MNWNIKSTLQQKDPKKRLEEIVSILLANRGILQDLDTFLNPPLPSREILFKNLPDLNQEQLNQAVDLIKKAIEEKKSILIYGDYDCDGVCASTILHQALQQLGANVNVFIPHRVEHGYGLSQKGVEEALKDFPDSLIITVDNGIAANDTVKQLRNQGIDVIVTDHHQPSDQLPPASAIVHTTFLSGSGVAWLLSSLLAEKRLPLDLVALATVCDLLPLTGVNRSLVKHGLVQMRKTNRPGLRALYQVSGIKDPNEISTYHLGFVLGPRINAIGRLGHALDAFKLLSAHDLASAMPIANILSSKNQDRQELTSDFAKIAFDHFSSESEIPKILFIADERFHEGIIGLIASKLVEKYYRPAIVVSISDGIAKASARSIPGFDITGFLQNLKEYFLSLGGHHQAAGFSFDPEKLKEIQEQLGNSSSSLDDELLIKKLNIELELEPSDINFDLLNSLQQFEPFGVDNSEPIFVTTIPVQSSQLLGKDKTHLKVILQSPFQHLDVIGFNQARHQQNIAPESELKCAFTLQKNTFLNKTKLQLLIKDVKFEDAV